MRSKWIIEHRNGIHKLKKKEKLGESILSKLSVLERIIEKDCIGNKGNKKALYLIREIRRRMKRNQIKVRNKIKQLQTRK